MNNNVNANNNDNTEEDELKRVDDIKQVEQKYEITIEQVFEQMVNNLSNEELKEMVDEDIKNGEDYDYNGDSDDEDSEDETVENTTTIANMVDEKQELKEYYVYSIQPIENDKMIYIGSTSCDLEIRFSLHYSNYERYKEGKGGYVSSYMLFDAYGFENCEITILEIMYDKQLLRQKEQEIISEYKNKPDFTVVNLVKAYTTDEDAAKSKQMYNKKYLKANCTDEVYNKLRERKQSYYVSNYGEISKYKSKLYHENDTYREKMRLSSKKHFQQNREKILARHKQYNIDNKERLQAYGKDYRKRREEKLKEKHYCDCGGHYTISQVWRHYECGKHQKWLITGVVEQTKHEQTQCECGGTYTKSNSSRHLKSKTHLKKIREKTNKK